METESKAQPDTQTSLMEIPGEVIEGQAQTESYLTLDGDLNLSDYVQDTKPTLETTRNISAWANQNRETTRTRLAIWLVKIFGCSLGVTFLLIGVAAFNPNVDKTLIKEIIPQVITPQVTLLGVALGFYFGSKD